MNTPSHIILNLAILRRSPKSVIWPVILGAIAPDAALFFFFFWARWVQQLPHRIIWREAYYQPFWQEIFAVGNSIPLALVGWGLCYRWRLQWGQVFCASMLLHHALDLPLHHDDAHRHFWPLSQLRVISPVSYWDPDHYGLWGAGLEVGLLLGASAYLGWQIRSPIGRGLLLLTSLFYLWVYLRAYLWPVLG